MATQTATNPAPMAPTSPTGPVSLGCGTLLLIALIVIIFSDNDSEREKLLQEIKQSIERVEDDLGRIEGRLDEQAATLEALREQIEADETGGDGR